MVMLLRNLVVFLTSAIITRARPEYEIYPDSEYVEYDDYAEYPNQELDLLPLVPLQGPEPDSNIHLPLETLPYGPQLNAELILPGRVSLSPKPQQKERTMLNI